MNPDAEAAIRESFHLRDLGVAPGLGFVGARFLRVRHRNVVVLDKRIMTQRLSFSHVPSLGSVQPHTAQTRMRMGK
jgi:hypothetical protein